MFCTKTNFKDYRPIILHYHLNYHWC